MEPFRKRGLAEFWNRLSAGRHKQLRVVHPQGEIRDLRTGPLQENQEGPVKDENVSTGRPHRPRTPERYVRLGAKPHAFLVHLKPDVLHRAQDEEVLGHLWVRHRTDGTMVFSMGRSSGKAYDHPTGSLTLFSLSGERLMTRTLGNGGMVAVVRDALPPGACLARLQSGESVGIGRVILP